MVPEGQEGQRANGMFARRFRDTRLPAEVQVARLTVSLEWLSASTRQSPRGESFVTPATASRRQPCRGAHPS